jgi:ankyrin repeat protein
MAGRDHDRDDRDDGAPPAQRARPDDPPAPVYVCGLEVGLLDVGRVVALNGYPEACRRLAFVSSGFYLERDLLMATKRVRYGGKQRTRLMSLSRTGDVERVSFLLKVHAEVDADDAWGWMSLQIASMYGHESVVRLLLDKGADVGARTALGLTSLNLIGGYTALRLASLYGHESVVRVLLDKGAVISAADDGGQTALHLASQSGHEAVVRLLLDGGADVGARATEGYTALHDASRNGHESVVRLLLDKGADVSATTAKGETALRLASEGHHEAVVALLREAGGAV